MRTNNEKNEVLVLVKVFRFYSSLKSKFCVSALVKWYPARPQFKVWTGYRANYRKTNKVVTTVFQLTILP